MAEDLLKTANRAGNYQSYCGYAPIQFACSVTLGGVKELHC